MYQVVLNVVSTTKVHVITEYGTKEEALNKFMALVEANKGSSVTTKGKYSIRKKPQT